MLIVKNGCWLYAVSVPKPVDIVGLPFDFWFELAKADEQLEPGEIPERPDEAGLLYYARFRLAGHRSLPTWPDSAGCDTIEAAMRAAEELAPSPIDWTLPDQPLCRWCSAAS